MLSGADSTVTIRRHLRALCRHAMLSLLRQVHILARERLFHSARLRRIRIHRVPTQSGGRACPDYVA